MVKVFFSSLAADFSFHTVAIQIVYSVIVFGIN